MQQPRQASAVLVGQLEEALEVFLLRYPAADGKEVDDLDEEAGVSLAGAVDHVHHLLQAIKKAVVTDAQQRTAGDITNSGGFHDEDARLRPGVALIPFEYLWSDKTIIRRAPRHHGRHPGARLNRQIANPDRRKPQAGLGLCGGWPVHRRQGIFFTDFLYWFVHLLARRGTCRGGSETRPYARRSGIILSWHALSPVKNASFLRRCW